MNVCLVPLAIFSKLKNEGPWGATRLRQIMFQIGEKTFTETFRMLQQAYGVDCLSRTQCHEWYQRFNRAERPSKTCPDLDVFYIQRQKKT